MKEYSPSHLRNLALVGHSAAGKTSFAEAILFSAKETARLGSVPEGNTVSDYHPDEIARKISINLSPLHCEWNDTKFNLLDTPGTPDFIGEMYCGMHAADTSVVVVDAITGVNSGTETALRTSDAEHTAMTFVVTKLDSDQADFDKVITQLQEMFGHSVTVAQFPAGKGADVDGIVDVMHMKLLRFKKDKSGDYSEEEIPADLRPRAEALHNLLVENVAEADEALMNTYFEKGSLEEHELAGVMRHAILERTILPVMCAVPTSNMGIKTFLNFAEKYLPSPIDRPAPKGVKPGTTDEVTFTPSPSGPLTLFIFKTVSEAHLGELSFFRVVNGTLTHGVDLLNYSNGKTERLNQIYVLNGKTRKEISSVCTGDIGAVVKLKDTHTNNTLGSKGLPITLLPVTFPIPIADAAIVSKGKGDEEKVAMGLHSLHEEDPTFQFRVDGELHQTIISGQGELQLDIIVHRLKEKYGVDVEIKPPRIPYRESIRGKAKVSYRHKKQSGGAGQFGEVHFFIEPLKANVAPPAEYQIRAEETVDLAWGGKLHFISSIVGGAVDAKFIPAVKKGILDIMQGGAVAGYHLSDVRVIFHDGMMHAVDSNENAFRTAAKMCFKNGVKEAKPMLMEPIYEIEVMVPEENMGDVMGDLSGRRGKISGMDARGHYQVIKAMVPLAELYQYSARLRSMTQGRGSYSRKFAKYEDVPKDVETKILEQSKLTAVEETD